MKLINRTLLLIFITLITITTVEAQEIMYIYKNGAVVGEHVLAEVDSVIFYQATQEIISDIDGNEYSTIAIGAQTWMAENLKTTTYNDGNPISNVTDNTVWENITIGAYCWYDNDEDTYKEPYGALYNWYAVETEKLCPSGWHVPSDEEWFILENYLIDNGYNYDGSTFGNKVAKSISGSLKWNLSNNTGVPGNSDFQEKINVTGLTFFPGGLRMLGEGLPIYTAIGNAGVWGSSSERDATYIYTRRIINSSESLIKNEYLKKDGLSIRCIKD